MTAPTTPASGRARPLEPARDLAAVVRLVEEAFDQEPGLRRMGSVDLALIRVASPLMSLTKRIPFFRDRSDGVVWEENGRIVGNVSFGIIDGVPRAWMIGNVAVEKSLRGRGISRVLTQQALDCIAARGGGLVVLDVREDNDVARHLYERLGFVQVERVAEFTLSAPMPSTHAHSLIREVRWDDRERLETIERRARGDGAACRPNIAVKAMAIAAPAWMRLTAAAFSARFTSAFISDVRNGFIDIGNDALFGKHKLRLVVEPGEGSITTPLLETAMHRLGGNSASISLEAIGDFGTVPDEIGFVLTRSLLRLQKNMPPA